MTSFAPPVPLKHALDAQLDAWGSGQQASEVEIAPYAVRRQTRRRETAAAEGPSCEWAEHPTSLSGRAIPI